MGFFETLEDIYQNCLLSLTYCVCKSKQYLQGLIYILNWAHLI